MSDRKLPFVGTPETNPETKPFWDGCAAKKLIIPFCVDTKKPIWYPRAISPFTFGAVEWKEVSGKGKVYSYSVMERAKPVYTIAYVELAEGTRMMTNIVNCDTKTIKIGMDVKLTWVDTEGSVPMPCFEPA
jgi:uncharacterized protein